MSSRGTRGGLLVVAGEASGDRAAARVMTELTELVPGRDVGAFGLGGPALQAAGVSLVADLRQITALGISEVAARAVPIALAHARIVSAARKLRPRAAFLVNYSEFNTLLAGRLHAAGVRVLWYIAPQIWAWRASRAQSLRRAIDRMAVILPFEENLWQRAGVDAHYVGHPAREAPTMDRRIARDALGLTPYASAVAILPGSRPHEVRAHLQIMLEAYERVRRDRASLDARVLLAASLDARTKAYAETVAEAFRVPIFSVDAYAGATPVLGAFDAALSASGTAALEAALARAVPVVVYRTGLVTELVARTCLTTSRISLPNILLGRTAFTELLQREADVPRVAKALVATLNSRRELLKACDEVEAILGLPRSPSKEVAGMLAPWLS
ncbi:lipid-A-disaccharide synthase [Pendulispora rubella]|uniref:Lipid-A-disaccharide synthase n=1 Tax=Pendulispora rubella TaxID=2741070 RepID=A0ABZ2LKQ4_9BACT